MLYVRRISRLSGFAGRQSAFVFLSLGIGMPGVCIAIFVAFGLAASPFIGSSAWEPFGDFMGGLSLSLTAVPGVLGVGVLALMAVALPAVACFGRWCLWQGALRPDGLRLLSLVRRGVALACSLRVLGGIFPNTGVVCANFANPCFLRRTLASTSAGLSGASPLLE